MSEKNVYLGIDTSNYTTSAALCSEEGEILLNCRIPLPVREGERGLRQSDAVFHHVRNLPSAARKVGEYLSENGCKIAAVGCSSSPRNAEGSYMPCFLAGESAAAFSAETLGVPIYKTSHQAGHIMAALYSACKNEKLDIRSIAGEKFIAFHVSGGTTDVLLCEPDADKIFRITQIGGSRDINGGQAVDRAGVMMGIIFPCGAEMDRAALGFSGKIEKSRLSVDKTYCNLSGLENKAAEKYKKTGSIAETSAYVLDFIARTLEKITHNAIAEYGSLPVIYAGGVMSSEYIRRTLGRYGMFADAQFSSDNASGVALITREKHIGTTKK